MTGQERVTRFKENYHKNIGWNFLWSIVEYEDKFKKEIKDFTYDEAAEFFCALQSVNTNSLQNKNKVIKDWIAYFYGAGCESVFDDLTQSDFESWTKEVHLFTRTEFTSLVNQLLNYSDKAIFEAFWDGFDAAEVEQFTRQTVSENRTVTIDGQVIRLRDELYDYVQKAFDERSVANYVNPGRRYPILETDGLFRMAANSVKNTNGTYGSAEDRNSKLTNMMKQIRAYFGITYLNKTTIRNSGLVYYVKQNMAISNMPLREYLRSTEGKNLLRKYGFKVEGYYYVQNFMRNFKKYFNELE